ncbi:MAG: 50S ribosomal protein L21 [Candidatus Omnitrophica bacterium]|nr:50S ribosomal protein L21 [Candidatus Omnitrophota bacterium]
MTKEADATYAVIQAGGLQYRVRPGDQFEVNRVDAAAGAPVVFDQVLLARPSGQIRIGQPVVPGAKVVCEVVSHGRGPKTIAFKYHRREHYKRKVGHRQDLTRLLVKDIQL